jgi:hypothetical protein
MSYHLVREGKDRYSSQHYSEKPFSEIVKKSAPANLFHSTGVEYLQTRSYIFLQKRKEIIEQRKEGAVPVCNLSKLEPKIFE